MISAVAAAPSGPPASPAIRGRRATRAFVGGQPGASERLAGPASAAAPAMSPDKR